MSPHEAVLRELHAVFRDYGANLARLNDNDLDCVAVRLVAAAVPPATENLRETIIGLLEVADIPGHEKRAIRRDITAP